MKVSVCVVVGALFVVSGCAQFTTDAADQAALQAAAEKAGEAYVTCVVDAAARYEKSGEAASLISEVAKKACSAPRSEFTTAENAWLKTKYMNTEQILQKDLAALDQRATLQIQQSQERMLEQKMAAQSASQPASQSAAAAAVSAPVASAAVAAVPVDGSAYLKCMGTEGKRYAGVNEPAEVIAEVAQSRCAALLTDSASAAQLEKQGRALVLGLVLDRKVSAP